MKKGPKTFDNFSDDFAQTYDKSAIPLIEKELAEFAGKLTVDTLISFTTFDEKSIFF